MPACFQLFKKCSTSPVRLAEVDDEICKALGIPPDEIKFCYFWYDLIGLQIALGKPLGSEELRKAIKEYEYPELEKVLSFLEEHYTSNAWYEHKSVV